MPEEIRRKVCENCHECYIEGDKYCRFCGAPMGEPYYIDEDFACIYDEETAQMRHLRVCVGNRLYG